jgi:hypothetical protein
MLCHNFLIGKGHTRALTYVYTCTYTCAYTCTYTCVRTYVILETGGRVNKAARDWLDTLTAPQPGEQVPSQDDSPRNPRMRTTTETALREAMQALVRVQAHMLARIVVEIRFADSQSSWNRSCLLCYHGMVHVHRYLVPMVWYFLFGMVDYGMFCIPMVCHTSWYTWTVPD